MASGVRQVDDFQEFVEIISNSEKPTLIDFTATWSGPCLRIGPEFKKLAEDERYSQHIQFIKVDVDENEDASEKAAISCMPTYVPLTCECVPSVCMGTSCFFLLNTCFFSPSFQIWLNGTKYAEFTGADVKILRKFAELALDRDRLEKEKMRASEE